MQADVAAVARTVMDLNDELIRVLWKSPVDLSTAQATAKSLLTATEDLRIRAYAFEDGRQTYTQ